MRWLIITLFSIVWFLSGCDVAKKSTSQLTETIDTDTELTTVRRKGAVTLPGRQVNYTLMIECDTVTNKPIPRTFSAANNGAFTRMEIDSTGIVTGVSGCDSLTAVVNELQTTLKQRSSQVTELQTSVEEEKNVNSILSKVLILALTICISLIIIKI